ncbi:MAG: A/G-specific adenine glycosylase [Chloroflexi bacterium]|nr:A/G-specific adenine glycosylase [Chloroflexota bacterium]
MSPVPSPFAARLLKWYARHARRLPFRETRGPYRVWVSEVMLQQTRMETVLPYFERWMERFPTLEALAAADLAEVLKAWEGLGYYARARNLHRAAQTVAGEYNGRLPETAVGLRQLPGVGRYTAGAIASIAFGDDVPALDGNGKRVLARVFEIRKNPKSAEGDLWALAASLLPPGRAGEFNQALMDFGATVCTPRQPACAACPLRAVCRAFALGAQADLPLRASKTARPHYEVTAAIVRRGGRVLIAQRPPDKLLGGLWEFPGGKVEAGETLAECLRRELREELGIEVEVGQQSIARLRHTYTHFRITLFVFECRLTAGTPRPLQVADVKWAYPSQLERYAMGKTDRAIARRLATPNA